MAFECNIFFSSGCGFMRYVICLGCSSDMPDVEIVSEDDKSSSASGLCFFYYGIYMCMYLFNLITNEKSLFCVWNGTCRYLW